MEKKQNCFTEHYLYLLYEKSQNNTKEIISEIEKHQNLIHEKNKEIEKIINLITNSAKNKLNEAQKKKFSLFGFFNKKNNQNMKQDIVNWLTNEENKKEFKLAISNYEIQGFNFNKINEKIFTNVDNINYLKNELEKIKNEYNNDEFYLKSINDLMIMVEILNQAQLSLNINEKNFKNVLNNLNKINKFTLTIINTNNNMQEIYKNQIKNINYETNKKTDIDIQGLILETNKLLEGNH